MHNDNLVINSLRFLSAHAVQKANSGHPGLPLGAAPMAYSIWGNHLNINPEDANWINRDRFILSAGHGSALLYSLLHMYGFNMSIEDIKNFRQIGSITPGHPEYGMTEGVEATTGPLGQGISMAVGMAIAEEHLGAKYNKEDMKLIDHYTYVLCSDGDLMEGVGYEAMSIAGTLGLSKLILLYDSNNITIDGGTDIAFTEDVSKRFEGFGFQVLKVEDGNDVKSITEAIEEAKKDTERPTLIEITTQIGYGVPKKVGKSSAHGEPLGDENILEMIDYFKWEEDEFVVPKAAYEITKSELEEKRKVYDSWKELEREYKEKYPEEYRDLEKALNRELPEDLFDKEFFKFQKDMASRAASGEVLNRIAKKVDYLMGGSADLAGSNKTTMEGVDFFSKENRLGRNIHFGVREHAMAAIGNGLALHGGVMPYVATFLIFSDYLKGAMRLSALMEMPLIYVLTHDSIGVGEDGPTHQPIEQHSMIRSLPNINFFRPADAVETAYAWKVAVESKKTPTVLALTRQTLPNLEGTGEGVEKGGYILSKENDELDIILMGSGSEVQYCIEAKEKLEDDGYGVRVVSIPCMDLFDAQDESYKESVLPKSIRNRVSIEAAATLPWYKYVGLDGIAIGLDRFGESGPGEKVYEHLDITGDRVYREALKVLK